MTDTKRDVTAQAAAEHIARYLIPQHDQLASQPGVTIFGNGDPMPRTVEDIKATLLDGRCFISWMDDHVIDAMNTLHGPPTGDADVIVPDDNR